MIDVTSRLALARQRHRRASERLTVSCGDPPPGCGPRLEPSELYPKERGLQLVEPARIAELEVAIAPTVAVMTQAAQPLGQVAAVGQDHPGVAAGAEVLGRVEREAGGIPPGPERPPRVRGADHLRRVLDHGHAVGAAELGDAIDGRRVTVQVDGDDGPRARGDGPRNPLGLERVRVRVDVDEDRGRPGHDDGRGGGDEGERARDHRVAGTDAYRGEGEPERVGAGRDADRVRDADVLGQVVLERLALRPKDEARGVEDAAGSLRELGAQRGVLAREIEEGDHRILPAVGWPVAPVSEPIPVPVVIGAPMPSRLIANRSSSPRTLRWTYSMLNAQHWYLMSTP